MARTDALRLQSTGIMSSTLRARVLNGRLTLDEPSDLPEATEVELFVSPTVTRRMQTTSMTTIARVCMLRSRRHASSSSARAGIPAAQVLDELRRQRT